MQASEWRAFRDLRLEALQESPRSYGSTYDSESRIPDEEWQHRAAMAATGARAIGITATVDGRWVGMARGVVDDEAPPDEPNPSVWLVGVYVTPEWRGRGVGRAVSEAVVDWARERGAREVLLHVADWNDGARRVYESIGFAATGNVETLPHDPSIIEIEMRLTI